MIEIKLNKEHLDFIKSKAPSLDIGGFSNLKKNDLAKATRHDFQITGLAGEAMWFLYRYNSLDKFKAVLDYKFATCRKNNVGDSGFDDCITYNKITKLVDIKTSHVSDEQKIQYLNLIIPPREYHKNMIYICAFTIGPDRTNINTVIFPGWCFTEDISKKWSYDNSKWCVPVKDLRDIKKLDKYIR